MTGDIEKKPTSVALSIVTTLYHSRSFLPEFLRQIRLAIEALSIESWELVAVVDGPTDTGMDYLVNEMRTDSHIRVIELSRNFGHHAAALCGLHHATGDLVYVTDCDLEISPAHLPTFMSELRTSKADVVYGFQENRTGPLMPRVGGALFWKLFNSLSDITLPANIVTERLLTRRYVDELIQLGDRNIFLGGMMYWVGFRQVGLPVQKKPRDSGSSYHFIHRITLALEAVTSFSGRPLSMMFTVGFGLSALSILATFVLVLRKIIFPESVLMGFTGLFAMLGISLGATIFSIGTVGLYIGRIFKQVQGRPQYIIRRFYETD
jgi:putative glycosyltransferase